MTIVQAAVEVLKAFPNGLTIKQLYAEICRRDLYKFSAVNPMGALLPAIRRQCYGVEISKAHPIKYFEIKIVDDVVYYCNAKVANTIISDVFLVNEKQVFLIK